MQESFSVTYQKYPDSKGLPDIEQTLLEKARQNTINAYAPYSNFRVSAAALLENGEIILGTNQENASYPAGICAERVLLSAAASAFPGVAIKVLAITYHNPDGDSGHPISPCGICRQSLLEHENRFHRNIRIVMSGLSGEVLVVESVKQLLPFNFSSEDMR